MDDVSFSLYDREDIIEGCTVHILTNTVTGEQSIGWWRGGIEDMPRIEADNGREVS